MDTFVHDSFFLVDDVYDSLARSAVDACTWLILMLLICL